MNAVQVGDPSFIPCSQWVKSMLFVCFPSCEYNLGCPAFMFVLYNYSVRTQDSVVMGVGNTLLPTYVLSYEFWMVYEVCVHFSLWVAIPITVSKEVAASTVGTKDPLSSDECSWSGRSEPYPLLSVSKINAVCMLSLLWVQCGMSSMHICAVYSVRTQDSGVMGVQSTLLPVYAVYYEFWMVYEDCVHFSLWLSCHPS